MQNKYLTLLILILWSIQAKATIYFALYDNHTQSFGIASITSGGPGANNPQWEIYEHNIGMVGAGGHGLCEEANASQILIHGHNAQETAFEIARNCDEHWPYYRLAIVTSQGDAFAHIGAQGCSSSYGECGAKQNGKIVAIGGGLEKGVLKNSYRYLENLSKNKSMPIECKFLATLKQVIKNGGEIKGFNAASMSINSPHKEKTLVYASENEKRDEQALIRSLENELKKGGVDCAN